MIDETTLLTALRKERAQLQAGFLAYQATGDYIGLWYQTVRHDVLEILSRARYLLGWLWREQELGKPRWAAFLQRVKALSPAWANVLEDFAIVLGEMLTAERKRPFFSRLEQLILRAYRETAYVQVVCGDELSVFVLPGYETLLEGRPGYV